MLMSPSMDPEAACHKYDHDQVLGPALKTSARRSWSLVVSFFVSGPDELTDELQFSASSC